MAGSKGAPDPRPAARRTGACGAVSRPTRIYGPTRIPGLTRKAGRADSEPRQTRIPRPIPAPGPAREPEGGHRRRRRRDRGTAPAGPGRAGPGRLAVGCLCPRERGRAGPEAVRARQAFLGDMVRAGRYGRGGGGGGARGQVVDGWRGRLSREAGWPDPAGRPAACRILHPLCARAAPRARLKCQEARLGAAPHVLRAPRSARGPARSVWAASRLGGAGSGRSRRRRGRVRV